MNAPTQMMPFSMFSQNDSARSGTLHRAESVRSGWSETTLEERRRRAVYIQAKLSEILSASDRTNG